jgi:hypothetical protein
MTPSPPGHARNLSTGCRSNPDCSASNVSHASGASSVARAPAASIRARTRAATSGGKY